jgi:hypothetical protein
MSTDQSVIEIDDAKSSRRADAARRNGARSRGPKTGEGKLHSSQNALKHGMHARTIVLPGESQKEYDQLRDEYLAEYNPAGPAERHEVETLYNAEWRIRRMRRMEVAHVIYRMEDEQAEKNDLGIAIGYQEEVNQAGAGGVAAVYNFEPKLQRDYDRALRRLLDLQKRRAQAPPPPPAIENRQNEPKPSEPESSDPQPATEPFRLTTDHRQLTTDPGNRSMFFGLVHREPGRILIP